MNKIIEQKLTPFSLQKGGGSPNHISPIGSLYFDADGLRTYQNIDGLSNWVGVFDSSNGVVSANYNPNTGIILFTDTTGGTFNVSGFFKPSDDRYVTGFTFNNQTHELTLTQTNGLIYDVDLGVLVNNITITGVTYDNNNNFIFTNSTGGTHNVLVNNFSGLTINGSLYSNIISGTTNNIIGSKGSIKLSGETTTAFIEISGSNTVGGVQYSDFIRVTNTSVGAINPSKTFRLSNTGNLDIINNAYTAAIFILTDSGSLILTGDINPQSYSNLPTSNYLYTNRTTNQTISSGSWANRDIIFNNVVHSNGITYNTTTGIASLTAGKVYRITSRLAWSAAAAYLIQFSCYDSLNNQLGPTVEYQQATSSSNNISDGTLDFIYQPVSNTDIKIKTSNGTNALNGEYIRGGFKHPINYPTNCLILIFKYNGKHK